MMTATSRFDLTTSACRKTAPTEVNLMQTSTTKKPFFFRLEPAQLLAELIQTADRGAWITQLLIDLSTGNATTPLADTMIQEALKYSEVKRAAVQKRWDKKAIHVNTPVIHVNTSELHSNTSSSNSNSNKIIIPPDINEVAEYCRSRNNKVDCEKWFDHYAARGWIMSNGKKMVDWKPAVRTWEKNSFSTPKQSLESCQGEYF